MFNRFSVLSAIMAMRLLPMASAGVNFAGSCSNYYLGNGVADGTSDLFIEAWCGGGATETGEMRPSLCTRLNLSDCYKNVDGNLTPYQDWETPNGEMVNTCDIESCAMRGDAWDGPIMSCYCQDTAGIWDLVDVDLNNHLGNEGGYLSCGKFTGTKTCKYPWTTEDGTEEPSELR